MLAVVLQHLYDVLRIYFSQNFKCTCSLLLPYKNWNMSLCDLDRFASLGLLVIEYSLKGSMLRS